MELAILCVSACALLLCFAALIVVLRLQQGMRSMLSDTERRLNEELDDDIAALRTELVGELRAAKSELTATANTAAKTASDSVTGMQGQSFERQDVRIRELIERLEKAQSDFQNTIALQLKTVHDQFGIFTMQNKAAMDEVRTTVQSRLELLQKDNSEQLEKMRLTVDEKLQKTLDERISQSFRLVNERLQEVYTGLGEMKTLANGVGDLKKVLSNVKTRGILGEYQLGALINEVLSPEQFEENIATKKGSTMRVEYAIRMPGENNTPVYLPVDAKFPGDVYAQLVDAYETGDSAAIAAAQNMLTVRIKGCAKDIRDKYIDPPNTTDFAIMFLPFEGLYAEVVRSGLVEVLQRQYKVNIAGPTTFAALLNSLQMGFRTLAIQKRSGEVWNVLGAVKTEFATFESVLAKAQERIEQTSAELDKLVGVRTRQINNKLRSVSLLPAEESQKLFEDVSTEK